MNSPESQGDVKKRTLLEHSKKPRYKGRTDPVHKSHVGRTPYCGDTIDLTIKLNSAGDVIEDIQFEGESCAIATASADLMAQALRGKPIDEALLIAERFLAMMGGQEEFPENPKELRKLNVMQVVSHPLRIKCAKLAWHTLKAALGASTVEFEGS